MITVPARAIRLAEDGIDRLIPLLSDRGQVARVERIRDELRTIRGGSENGTRIAVDQIHIEEMRDIVGAVCLNGGLGIEHHEVAHDVCTAMRELGLQMESVIG